MVAVLLALSWNSSAAGQVNPAAAATMRDRYAAMQPELAQSVFAKPLLVRSEDSTGKIQGDVFAVVDFPFAQVVQAVNNPAHWCDIMILHINTKYCRAKAGPDGMQITVHIGKKTPENLVYTKPLVLDYVAHPPEGDYLNIGLSAQLGPIGTSDYQIVLEAVALPAGRSFLHLSYAYRVNMMGKLALQTYLATVGRNKVGFSLVPGTPGTLTGGVRGVVERNTMRYFLAIHAYLEAEQLPARERQEARLLGWISATERYPDQLLEMDRASYLEMKRAELVRQQMPR
jgi:hypothetical protein